MDKKVIVFQGDSITDCSRDRSVADANVNACLGHGYAKLVSARLRADYPAADLQCFNRGISGNRVVDLYARWKIDALNLNPDVMSILIGVNDTWHAFGSNNGVEVPRYDKFYRMLLDWTFEARPDIKLILLEPFVLVFGAVAPEWVAEIDQRREVVKKIAADYNLPLVLTQDILNEAVKKAPQEYWLLDGVHPTLAGHQLIADAWLKTAKEAKIFD